MPKPESGADAAARIGASTVGSDIRHYWAILGAFWKSWPFFGHMWNFSVIFLQFETICLKLSIFGPLLNEFNSGLLSQKKPYH